MEFIYNLLAGIAIGFVCIAYPIILLISLYWMPWYVSVAFCVWLVGCIGSIAFLREKDNQWYRRIIPTLVLTFGFTILFLASADTSLYMFDNLIVWAITPALNLPAIFFIGSRLYRKMQVKYESTRQAYNESIDKQINDINIEIQKLEHSVNNRVSIIHFIDMLECCGENVSGLANDSRVSNIGRMISEIKKNKEEIQRLHEKKR